MIRKNIAEFDANGECTLLGGGRASPEHAVFHNFAELDTHPEACEPIRSAARHGRVTLIYSSHDAEHNNAVALKEYLSAQMGKKGTIKHA